MKTTSYEGKQVYIGLDVHREFFVASCICEGVVVKRCRMPGTAEAVVALVRKEFPGATVLAAYEAGYSGFWLHRKLEAAGVSCIVVHVNSIEVSSRDMVKTDKRDSLKIAEQLAVGRLRGIRVPSVEEEQKRLLTRTREQLMRKKRRVMVQIRMRLHYFGLFPESITGRLKLSDVTYILVSLEGELQRTIGMLRDEWRHLAGQIKEIDRILVEEGKNDPLDAVYRSVPGIGSLIARVLSSELGDMSQFPNERALFSFTGLTPTEYSSGGHICRGHISRQGNTRLRHMLVEASWKAVRKDPVLKEYYVKLSERAGKKRAIVAVARKLIGRIRAALRKHEQYQLGYQAPLAA
jgi:transposase